MQILYSTLTIISLTMMILSLMWVQLHIWLISPRKEDNCWEVHIFRVLIPIVEFFLPCTQKVLVHLDCIVLHSDPISKVSRLLNLGRCRWRYAQYLYNIIAREIYHFWWIRLFTWYDELQAQTNIPWLWCCLWFFSSHQDHGEPFRSHTKRAESRNVLTASSSSSKTSKGNYQPIFHWCSYDNFNDIFGLKNVLDTISKIYWVANQNVCADTHKYWL